MIKLIHSLKIIKFQNWRIIIIRSSSFNSFSQRYREKLDFTPRLDKIEYADISELVLTAYIYTTRRCQESSDLHNAEAQKSCAAAVLNNLTLLN